MVSKRGVLLVVLLIVFGLVIQTSFAVNELTDCGTDFSCIITNSAICNSSTVNYTYSFDSGESDYNWTDKIEIQNVSENICSLYIETISVSIDGTVNELYDGMNSSCQFTNSNLTNFLNNFYLNNSEGSLLIEQELAIEGNCEGKFLKTFEVIEEEEEEEESNETDTESNTVTSSETNISNVSNSNTTDDYSCTKDSDCTQYGTTYSCSELTSICIDNSTDYSNDDLTEVSASVASLSSSINSIKNQLGELDSSVNDYVGIIDRNVLTLSEAVSKLEETDANLGKEISTVSSKIETIETDLEITTGDIQTIEANSQTALSGLELLEQDISSTKEEIGSVEAQLEQRAEKEAALRNNSLLLMILTIFGSLAYFIVSHNKIRTNKRVTPDVKKYLTTHIKRGSTYDEIEKHLLKSGWPKKEIKRVYQLTTQENYFDYLKSKGKVHKDKKFHSSVPPNNNKIIVIAVMTILILGSLILFVSNNTGNTGQAIYMQKLIGGEIDGTSGLVTYGIDCTSPHILTEDQNYCCLDANDNNICDYTEEREEEIEQTFGIIARSFDTNTGCQDNLQCSSGLCIDGECGELYELYSGTGDCSKRCDYYSVKISTSDNEEMNVVSNQGSYTGAGGLEWVVLNGVDHCQGEPAIIPIKIRTKRTGEIINEKVITLHEGQSSNVFNHPDINNLAFSLTIEDIYEVCE